MSIHIVAFGNERGGYSEDDQQSSLIWTYLGRSTLVSETDGSLLLNPANYLRNPSFTKYQACVFGNVRLVVHDCPLWYVDWEPKWFIVVFWEFRNRPRSVTFWKLIFCGPDLKCGIVKLQAQKELKEGETISVGLRIPPFNPTPLQDSLKVFSRLTSHFSLNVITGSTFCASGACSFLTKLEVFDSDWYTSRNLIGEADIIVIKYSVNDKSSFQEIKDIYAPLIKKALNHCSVPVIISAVGARQDEVPCTCPLCISDRRSCVTASEGIQLAKELRATYLELHSLNDFYIGKYFGGVLEYFMIQSLNQKSSEKMKKRKKTQKCHEIKPPQLEQPEKMPILKGEASHYDSDLHNLLYCCKCVDVIFYSEDLKEVAEAHRIVLCSVSHVFMLLFDVKSPDDIQDSSIIRTAQTLFAMNQEAVHPVSNQGSSCITPVKVIVKDSFFCSCLSDILHFIYSAAFQWELLEEHIKKRLKDPGIVELVLEKVKCILKIPGKVSNSRNCRSYVSKRPLQLCNSSLRLFFNTPVLADVMFKIQGAVVPAHRAVLVARCKVMAAMFSGNYIESNSFLVPVFGISKDTFLSFLEYLYTDSCCPASILQAMSLLICAEMYQVSRLQHICELYIITQLQSMPSRELASTSLSVVSLLRKAKFHNSDCLSNWLLHFIASNYLIFSQKPEFEDLSVEERNFVEMHRWPSSMYLKQLSEYRNYIHSRKCHCVVM